MRNYLYALFGFCLVGLLATCSKACDTKISVQTNKPVARLKVPDCAFSVILPDLIAVPHSVNSLDIVTPNAHYVYTAVPKGYKMTNIIIGSGSIITIEGPVTLLGLGGGTIDIVSPIDFELTLEAR